MERVNKKKKKQQGTGKKKLGFPLLLRATAVVCGHCATGVFARVPQVVLCARPGPVTPAPPSSSEQQLVVGKGRKTRTARGRCGAARSFGKILKNKKIVFPALGYGILHFINLC